MWQCSGVPANIVSVYQKIAKAKHELANAAQLHSAVL